MKDKRTPFEIHKEYIKTKGIYPFNASTEYFKDEEIQLIKKFGYWFEGLCSGELPVINYEQKIYSSSHYSLF